MRHRLKRRVFDGFKNHQKSRTSSTFTKENKLLHSKSTYFYRWSSGVVVPSACSLALLFGGIMAVNPSIGSSRPLAYAESVDVANDTILNNVDINEVDITNDEVDFNGNIMLLAASPTIALSFNDNASFTTNATVDNVSYITNTFTVNASGLSGYTIKLSAMNGSGPELHGRDNYAATIRPVANNTLPAAFANDTWGYSISENTETSPDSLAYNAMPSYGTPKDILTKTDLTGAANEDKTYLLSFAAKFSAMSPSDHYTGNFQLSVTPQAFVPSTYRLNFNANEGDTSSIPANQSFTEDVLTASHEFTIPNTTPTRSGYAFMGWATTQNGTAQYAPGSKITIVKSSGVTVTLYAVWSKDTVYTLNYNANNGTGAPAVQSQTVSGSSSATSYTFTISNTKPTRTGYTFLGWAESNTDTSASYQPNGSYTIQKNDPTKTLYAVWEADGPFNGITTMQAMTSTICSDAKEGDEAILEDTRDNKKYYVTKLKDGNCWMTQNLAYNGGGTATSVSSWTSTTSSFKAYNRGTHTDGSHTSIGNYYSYGAANTGGSTDGDTNSVCPVGWQLPVGNPVTADKSFGKLVNSYGIGNTGSKLTQLPLYFQYGGYLNAGRLDHSDTYGYYWSSTPDGSVNGYYLSFSSSYANPSNYSGRYDGYSVRCVAK